MFLWCTFDLIEFQTGCAKRSDLTFFYIMFDGTLMFLAYFEDEVGGSIDGSCGAAGATVLLSSVLVLA
jgi:hypothetical protein